MKSMYMYNRYVNVCSLLQLTRGQRIAYAANLTRVSLHVVCLADFGKTKSVVCIFSCYVMRFLLFYSTDPRGQTKTF